MFSRILSTAKNLLYSDPANEEDNQEQLSPVQTAEEDQSESRSRLGILYAGCRRRSNWFFFSQELHVVPGKGIIVQ